MDTHYIEQLEKMWAEKDALAGEVAELRARMGLPAPPPHAPASAPLLLLGPPAPPGSQGPPGPPLPHHHAAQYSTPKPALQAPGTPGRGAVGGGEAGGSAAGGGGKLGVHYGGAPPMGIVRAGGAVENGRMSVGDDLKALMVRLFRSRVAAGSQGFTESLGGEWARERGRRRQGAHGARGAALTRALNLCAACDRRCASSWGCSWPCHTYFTISMHVRAWQYDNLFFQAHKLICA